MPYSLKDPEENITAIGSSTYSPFSFRCLLTISGKTFKELPIQDYISKFNQYIQFICQQKNISAESICTYIYIPDDANFDDLEKLFSQLRKIQTFKCLNTHFSNINETLHKLLFESFDFIVVMDDSNKEKVLSLSFTEEQKYKVKKMTDYCCEKFSDFSSVPDPYYGRQQGFSLVLDILEDACFHFFEKEIRPS
jgi:protein-tyrosine-phosphatase